MSEMISELVAEQAQRTSAGAPSADCPDGGSCHHLCAMRSVTCFRVRYCGPLSGVFPGNIWPEAIREQAGEVCPECGLIGEHAAGCMLAGGRADRCR